MRAIAEEEKMSYRTKLRYVPVVITRLRRRAGHPSQRAAVRAIRKQTGHPFAHPSLSRWERGEELPSLRALVIFLDGLGYDLKGFQDELDRAADEIVPEPRPDAASPTPAPPGSHPGREAAVVRRLQELEERLRSLETPSSGQE